MSHVHAEPVPKQSRILTALMSLQWGRIGVDTAYCRHNCRTKCKKCNKRSLIYPDKIAKLVVAAKLTSPILCGCGWGKDSAELRQGAREEHARSVFNKHNRKIRQIDCNGIRRGFITKTHRGHSKAVNLSSTTTLRHNHKQAMQSCKQEQRISTQVLF